MKQTKIILLLIFSLFTYGAWTQSTANYTFSTATTGSLIDMSSGTTQLLGAGQDDAQSSITNIGFTFYLMAAPYTQFSVNSNGMMGLGSTTVGTSGTATGSTTAPKIAPFGGDQATISLGTGGKVHYKVTGSAPNRVLVIEWLNMKMNYSGYATATTGDGTYQALLYESSGKVEFVYGNMTVATVFFTGPVVGFSAGTSAGQIASVTTSTNTVTTSGTAWINNVYTVGNIANLHSAADGSRTVYTFTPPSPPPAGPINISFTAISKTGMTVNWVDNSTNEVLFIVKRATDAGFTQNVVNTSVASTTTAGTGGAYNTVVSGLQPATTYYFSITAVNEGSVSSALTGNQATNPPGTVTAIATGNWSAGSTWDSGSQPTSTDNAVIPAGFTVKVDNSANTCYNLTIDNGGTVDVLSGTSFKLTVNNNLTNNGTLDLYTSGTVYATLAFTGAYNSTFSGTGATTDLGVLEINKGSGTITTSSPTIEIMPTNLTIKGSSNTNTTAGACLTLTNGIVKFSGSYTITNAVFQTASYSIASSAGFWLNNANFTVAGLNGSPTMSGYFRVSNGVFNIGTASGNSMGFSSNSIIFVDGGSIVATGRFGVATAGNTITYNQSGGNITVCTVGNASTSLASFDLGTSATSNLTLSGGTITHQLAGTGASGPRDFRGGSTSVIWPSYTGTTLYLGNASSGTSKTFYISGSVPPMQITTTSATHKVALSAATYYYGDLTIPATSDLNLNGYGFWTKGNVVNDGTVTGTVTSSRFDFAGNLFSSGAAQTYSGSGSFGASTTPVLSFGINNSNGVTLNSMIYALAVNLFGGTLTNSNTKLTIGNGTTGSASVQIGGVATTPGGFFDNYPILNLGTGTFTLLYSAESVSRTTGFEIPSSRAVTNVTISNTNGVTLNGGDLTLGTATVLGTLTMTSGIFTTSGSSVILSNTGTTISGGSSTSYVNGKLVRSFPASRTAAGTYTTATFYPIGKGATYLPLYIDPTTNAGGTVTFSGEAFTSNAGTMGAGVNTLSTNRWEALVTTGGSNLTSTFLRIGDAGILSSNQILQSTAAAGSYGSVPSTSTYAAGTPNTLTTTGSQIPVASYFGYFAYGDLTTCATPTTQPTNFVTTNMTSSSFTGSWTAAAPPVPSHYLVVRYASGGTPTNPVNFTNYTSGTSLGTGTVRYSGSGTTFNETGLTASNTYDYYVYSYNNSGCYGPVYLVTSPLYAAVTTCAVVGVPGTPVASNVAQTSYTLTWTASIDPGVTYVLDVATDAAFTSFVSGYNGLNVGSVLTYNVTGLSTSTLYYNRIKAVNGSCNSAYTSTVSVTTLCNAVSFPWTENFDGVTIPAFPSCWIKENGDWVTTNNANSSSDADARSGTQFLRETWSATNEYIWTPGFNLTSGNSYDFAFWWAGDNFAGWTGDVFYNTSPTSSGATQLGTSFVVPATTTTKTYAEVLNSFTPSSSGTYYFAIRVNATSVPYYLSFDDFSFNATPACTSPTGLTSSNITTTSATISWTASPSSFTGYDYEVRTSGAPGSGATGLVASGSTAVGVTTANITGLTANTTYSFYVRTKCKVTTSSWAGPGTFFTGYCTPAPSSVDGNGITNVSYSTVNNPTGAESGNYGNYSTLIGDVQRSATIPVNITFETGFTYDTKIWIDYNDDLDFADSGEEVYTGTSLSTNPTTLNASFIVPVGAPLGNHRMRIGGVDVGPPTPCYTGTWGTYEDYTVNVIVAPTCPAPTALTATAITANSASIGWTAGGSETAWEYVYGLSPLAAPSGSGTATSSNSAALSMLSSASTYQFYVRANCGSEFSSWAGPYSFTTLCSNLTSFVENFDGVTAPALPTCWGNYTSPSYSFQTVTTVTSLPYSSPNVVQLYSSGATASGDAPLLISPPISNLNAGNYRLRFYAKGASTNLSVIVGTMSNPSNAATFTSFSTVGGLNTSTYTEVVVDFSSYSGSDTYIALKHPLTATYSYIYIDDVKWEAIPTDVVDWANLQWPPTGNIYPTNTYDSYGRVWEPGVTDNTGQGAGISAWVGYSTTNTNPSTWSSGNWFAATYNVDAGNNDEYKGTFPANTFAVGTYYYAYRYQLNGGPYKYGGYSSGGGGFWDGTAFVNGMLTVDACPTVSTSATPTVICVNESSLIQATSGNSNYSYAWNPGGLSGASHTVTPLVTTQYSVTATDAGTGCIVTNNLTVNVKPLPVVSITPAAPININCGDIQQLTGVLSPLASDYIFTPSSGSFTALSGGTTVAISDDDLHSGALPIGFSFKFENTSYTNVYANSNGFLSFNTSSGTATASQWRTNASSAPAVMLPLLAPLWDDLDALDAAGVASYKTEGVAPNRIFTMEWLDWEWGFIADAAVISFQVKLYETSNKVEFIYRQEAGSTSSPNASIGLMTSSTNYLMLNGTGASPGALNNTFTTSLSTKPATGQVYAFEPPVASNYFWSGPSGTIFTDPTASTAYAGQNLATVYVKPIVDGANTYSVAITGGNGCSSTATRDVGVTGCSTTLNLIAYIEGFMNGTAMRPVLDLCNPEPNGYTNTQCDNITVELRNSTTPYGLAHTFTGIINTNGTLTCTYPGSVSGNSYYVVLKHRNALETWSASPVAFTSNTTYNFSTGSGQAYGGNMVQVGSVWCIYSGDIVQDGNLDYFDLNEWEDDIINFGGGYVPTDLTGEGNVDYFDLNVWENNFVNFIGIAKP